MASTRQTSIITPRTLADTFDAACARLDSLGFASALWRQDLAVWTDDPNVQRLIGNRLGWLRAIDIVAPQLPRLRDFAARVRQDGFTDVVLLGMGGSSLAPEVLRQVLGSRSDLRLRILDSVDPEAVRAAMDRPRDTLFVLASKSGTTIEPNVMAAEARRRVVAAGHPRWATRFIAITDPDTALHRRAVDESFREVFVNPADIGGRYSALSFFGMVPAALMGLDLDALLAEAAAMAAACRVDQSRENPGLALGALMAAGARAGRDKLTVRLPPELASFGLWVEQLVAESTGKQGKGIVPVTGEPAGARLGDDRVVVDVSVGDQPVEPSSIDRDHVPHAGLHLETLTGLGAEFVRWEVATAAAGLLLGINPFDEPNVQQAKDATRTLLETYRHDHHLPFPDAVSVSGLRLTLSTAARTALGDRPVQSFLELVGSVDYTALLAYVPSEDARWRDGLQALRAAIATRTGGATTVGYGPRYLHSTGQLHKGGANNGVFLVITAEADEDLQVPGEPYSFGVLETAQALGDFQSLDGMGRRAAFIRLARRDVSLVDQISRELISRE